MIIESIVFAIFICSLGGIALILIRKAPVLATLSHNGKIGIRDYHLISNIEKRIKGIYTAFKKQIFLHKLLSWIKVLVIKVEVRIDHLLRGIRKKAQQIDKETKDE